MRVLRFTVITIVPNKLFVFHRYMGIGLSAQGVNMNRLPGECVLVCASLSVCVCVCVCVRLVA